MPPTSDLQIQLPATIGVATYPPGATFGPRAARDYEFVWINEGNCQYTHDGVTVDAPPGSIVLCRPGIDAFRWDPDRRTRHSFFHFFIERYPDAWPRERDWPLVRLAEEGDILRPLFRHVLTWHAGGDRLLLELSIAQMMTAYVTGQIAARDVPRVSLPDPVERALQFIHETIEEEPANPLTLDDLADAAAVTPEHLCRLFKSATGHTPAETVRLARLDRAATLLARSNYSVNQVAELCGFASPFHFSRRFRDAYERSPRQFRQDIEAGATPPIARLTRATNFVYTKRK